MTSECGSCGIQLNDDGTVDALDGEPDQHYSDCTALFIVTPRQTSRRPTRYGMARDDMRQRRAMSGPRINWKIEVASV